MEKVDIEQFYLDFRQEVALEATREEAEIPTVEAFVGVMINELAAASVFDEAISAPYRSRGVEVSGYSLSDDSEDLAILVPVFKQSPSLETTTSAEIDTAVNRAMGFLSKVGAELLKTVEESTPAFDMIITVNEAFSKIRKVRIVILTDGLAVLKEREKLSWYKRDVLVEVWDIRRLYQLSISGKPQEAIDVFFTDEFGESIPCLETQIYDSDCQVHLAILPGAILAEIYEKYGERLLERNVRAFLQARGKVNSGIRRTILEKPERFLAYNNGISATASEVEIVGLPNGGVGISVIRDLQIVNGGQTTASIHYVAKRDRERHNVDLSKLYVQTKLTVVPASKLDEIVPLISRYANSQNKVNEADFEANSPFHVSIENFSRRVWAPAKSGEPRMTHWFYERARGQYADALSREPTPAKRRDFKLINPLAQKFTKTDLARFFNCWNQLPHIASLGAEKSFKHFTIELMKETPKEITQRDFQEYIAMAILYRQTEKIVTQKAFGGYRANIVAYTISLLSKLVNTNLDLEKIWIDQNIDSELSEFLAQLCELVRDVLVAAPGNGNVTEWCKKRECWNAVSLISITVPQFSKYKEKRKSDELRDLGNEVLEFLTEKGFPMDRATICRELAMGNKEWTATIRELIETGFVSKIGRASEALYFLKDES